MGALPRLFPPAIVQGHVCLPLPAALQVPIGLSMPDQVQARHATRHPWYFGKSITQTMSISSVTCCIFILRQLKSQTTVITKD
jgi:hypothetical protein